MSAKHTPGPWIFQPHGGFGVEIGGLRMPFGYISTAHPRPIFELDTFLERPRAQLVANARLMAAAPDLLVALQGLFAKDECGTALDCELCATARAAIARATGEA